MQNKEKNLKNTHLLTNIAVLRLSFLAKFELTPLFSELDERQKMNFLPWIRLSDEICIELSIEEILSMRDPRNLFQTLLGWKNSHVQTDT